MSAVESQAPAPPAMTGMGAIPQPDGGVMYRVWAPNATAMAVGGDFTHAGVATPLVWHEIALKQEANPAYWSVFVPDAVADSLYKFKVTNQNADTSGIEAYWPWRHDPYAQDATAIVGTGNSVVVDRAYDWSDDHFTTPPKNQLVIYELHVGTFNRTEAGVQGTFEDAKAKLKYVADLGFNAIQVMPAFDFGSTTSMGYNPALPFAMANAYGTTATMKDFIKMAHQLGLAVILDVVYNHFGPGLESCLRNFDGTTNEGWQGIYFYQDARLITPFGSRPDFGRGEVRQYIRDHAIDFCLGQLHADGLRLDSTIGIRRNIEQNNQDAGPNGDGWTLLRWLGEEKRSLHGQAWIVCEDLQNDPDLTRDALFGGMGLDSQWDNWFLGRLRHTMTEIGDGNYSVLDVAGAVTKSYNTAGPFERVVYLESHDEAYQKPRLPSLIAPADPNGHYARKRILLGTALMMTAPGTPMIFMGQEFLEQKPWSDSDPTFALDWSRVSQFAGIVEAHRRLAQLRRNWDNNTRGLHGDSTELLWSDPMSGVLVYRRYALGGPGDDVIVIANLSAKAYRSFNVGFPAGGTWYLRFDSDWRRYSADFGDMGYNTTAEPVGNMQQAFSGNVGVNAYSALVYSQ